MRSKLMIYIGVLVVGIAVFFFLFGRPNQGQKEELEETIEMESESFFFAGKTEADIEETSFYLQEETEVQEEMITETLSKESKQTSQDVAEQFIAAFYKRSPEYDYIEAVKALVDESYYEFLSDSDNLERQTLDRERQEVVSLEFTDTADKETEEHISYAVFLTGSYISNTGEETTGQDMYVVTLEKNVEGDWKVIGSWRNIRN